MKKKQYLVAYLLAAGNNLNWSVGNRHSTLISLASTLNKAGFDEEDAVAECTSRYAQSDFDTDEIEKTVRDVYRRYSSEHGTKQKSFTPQKDKGTKGHKGTLPDNEEELIDDDKLLPAKCPDVEEVRKYVLDFFYKYIINPKRSKEIQFTTLIAFLTATGAMFKSVRCLIKSGEVATAKLYYLVSGPAASGKSCIGRGNEIFRIHAKHIENESKEEARKKKEEHKNWEKCQKNCKEGDCGCGAEPVIPALVKIDLSLNISSSRLIQKTVDNGPLPCLLYTTEIDSNLDMKENPLSPTLRATYEGEPISSYTQIRGDVYKDKTQLALLAAGTPAQLTNFFKNKENGLASRCLNNYLPESPYQGLKDEGDLDYDTYKAHQEAFEERAKTFSQYAMNAELTFNLTKSSREMIDTYIKDAEMRYARFSSDSLDSFIRRLTKKDVNLAMILTVFGLYEKGIRTGKHDIPDEIIALVISWNDFWIDQHVRLLSSLPDIPVNKDSYETTYAYIFEKLPCKFTFGQAAEIFKIIQDVHPKTVQRVLKKWVSKGRLRSEHRCYYKADCPEAASES